MVDGKEISALWEELKILPTLFSEWQRRFFEHGARAFEAEAKGTEVQLRERIASLEAKLQKRDTVLVELMEEHVALKKSWGRLTGKWVESDVRDAIVDFVHQWQEKTALKRELFLCGLNLRRNKFRSWEARYGQENCHNGQVPRDWWLEPWEREAIVSYYLAHPLAGYRALTYMMLDADIAAVSPATTYRVLQTAGLLTRGPAGTSQKGRGFVQPLKLREHWHMDIAYVNMCSTFYYFIAVLDGYSRSVVHWDIREAMTEPDIGLVLERAKERYPATRPRIITDNGKQFVAHDFKVFIRLSGMSRVRTSPSYPHSNGKVERFHGTLKRDCIRPRTPVSLADAKRAWPSLLRGTTPNGSTNIPYGPSHTQHKPVMKCLDTLPTADTIR